MNAMLKKAFLRPIFIVVLFTLCAGAQAGLQEGLRAYSKGNFPAALKELKPLAEKGDAKAQYMLAIMYENGQRVARDYKQAALWFSKSSEQGNDQAMLHLAAMYSSGRGITPDFVLAHKWYDLAGAAGNEYAYHVMKSLEARMTPRQIEKAKALAKEWLAKHKRKTGR